MKNFFTIEEIINELKMNGVKFGKGNPYNRLRYYTKIGWLPHMVRKKDVTGKTTGHYPYSTINRVLLIEKLKNAGCSNHDIEKRILREERLNHAKVIFNSDVIRQKLLPYVSFVMIIVILLSEAGLVRIGKSKNLEPLLIESQIENRPSNISILASGSAFMPKNERRIIIDTPYAINTAKVYVTFNNNYSPATRFWVADIVSNKSFTVELDAPVINDAEFDWWISN